MKYGIEEKREIKQKEKDISTIKIDYGETQIDTVHCVNYVHDRRWNLKKYVKWKQETVRAVQWSLPKT